MAKITWLGEDTESDPGPSFLIWGAVKFPKGQAVEVEDPHIIMKAKANTLRFKVQEKANVEAQEGKEEDQYDRSQRLKEESKKDYDYRQAEKGSGYTPIKKKVRKKKVTPSPVAIPGPSDADA